MNNNDDFYRKYEDGTDAAGNSQPDEPKMYRVILHNDHYTTMDFVVTVLMKIFQKSAAEATKIMLDVHKKGSGHCGTYTYDIAVTKIAQVHKMAAEQEFPLKCSCEDA